MQSTDSEMRRTKMEILQGIKETNNLDVKLALINTYENMFGNYPDQFEFEKYGFEGHSHIIELRRLIRELSKALDVYEFKFGNVRLLKNYHDECFIQDGVRYDIPEGINKFADIIIPHLNNGYLENLKDSNKLKLFLIYNLRVKELEIHDYSIEEIETGEVELNENLTELLETLDKLVDENLSSFLLDEIESNPVKHIKEIANWIEKLSPVEFNSVLEI